MFFLFAFAGYSGVHVRPQIQVSAQRGEDLYLQVGDRLGGGGQGGRGHGAVQQGVGRVAARGVRRLPVRLQVVGQMLAGVLQLVLIQDDVKQLLQAGENGRLVSSEATTVDVTHTCRLTHRWTLSQLVRRHHLHV